MNGVETGNKAKARSQALAKAAKGERLGKAGRT